MAERRYTATAGLRIESRGDGQPPVIRGHGAVFNQWTTLYEGRYWVWREVVRPGAFTRAIEQKQDVRGLFNHDPNFVLGRTRSGTLQLAEDDIGLEYVITLPTTQTITDLVLEPIRRRDITGSSFSFDVRAGDEEEDEDEQKAEETPEPNEDEEEDEDEVEPEEEYGDGVRVVRRGGERITYRREGERLIEERELIDLDLYDVSPVTYPAYEGTDVSARARPDLEWLIAVKDRPYRRPAPARRRWADYVRSIRGRK